MEDLKDLQIGFAGEHLVCVDLILRGHRAYMLDQTFPYDIFAEIDGKTYRVQVKTTRKPMPIPQRKQYTPAYLFWTNRCGSKGRKTYKHGDFDFLALVALDKKIVAYVEKHDTHRTMHFNEEKLRALTFENLWKKITNYTSETA
jgi:hypothetical protein